MSGRRGGGANGFTLLEMMVALLILGFIIAGLAGSTRLGFAAVRAQAHVEARGDGLEPADRLLRRVVAGMSLPNNPERPGLVGHANGFICITADPAPNLAPNGGGTAPRWDASLGRDGNRLVLRWLAHVHAERLTAPLPPRQAVLLTGLAALEISYLSTDRTEWLATWSGTSLPALVRIQLVFAPGDPRHWPPIVAATRQTRALARTSG